MGMKAIISGKEVVLTPRDVKIAKKINTQYLQSVKQKAEERNAPTFYVTALILLHMQTQELLNNLSGETVQLMLNASYLNAHRKGNEPTKKK